MRDKVLVIGLDGASFELVKKWIANNKTPNLKAIAKNGVFSSLHSVYPTDSATAWASLTTGVQAGKHGIFGFSKREKKVTSMNRLVNAHDVKVKRIWDYLSEQGYRVGIVNVPLTYPPSKVNGFMITGVLTPSESSNFTYPLELNKLPVDYEIDIKFEKYGFIPAFTTKTSLELIDTLTNIMRKRAKAVLILMNEYDLDFLFVVFTILDRLQHLFWDKIKSDTNTEPLEKKDRENYYLNKSITELDKWIGKIVQTAGQKTTTLIVSDHGFSPSPTKLFHINTRLQQMNLYQLKKTPMTKTLLPLQNITRTYGLKLVRSLCNLGIPLGDRLTRIGKRLGGWEGAGPQIATNWDSSIAYGMDFGVAVNSRIKQQLESSKYERLRENIIQSFLDCTDKFEKKVIKNAVRREEMYKGPHVNLAPDIIIQPEDDYRPTLTLGNKVITNIEKSRISGGHVYSEHARINGILFACGNQIKKGQVLSGLSLLDVVPTIMHILRIPIPEEMDGIVLSQIFEPKSEIAKRKPKYTDSSYTKEVAFKEKTKTTVDRLKKLGKF